MTYILSFVYVANDLPDYDLEESLDKTVGGEHKSSTLDNGKRGINWRFETEQDAKSGQRRLNKFVKTNNLKMKSSNIGEEKVAAVVSDAYTLSKTNLL